MGALSTKRNFAFHFFGVPVRLTKYAISSDRQRLIGKMPTFGVHLIFQVASNSKFKNKRYGGIFGQVRGKKGVIYCEYHFRDWQRLRGRGSRGSGH